MATSDWRSFPCPGSSPRWRYLDDGSIEVEGKGVPQKPLPLHVTDWIDLMTVSAARYSLPLHWLAAIMAIETGGMKGGRADCFKLADGTCAQNEGAGLMAMLPSTASMRAGRHVSSEELIADNALAIDLGAQYLRLLIDRDGRGDDFVPGALAYNAGSVRCGTGSTWVPKNSGLPRFPCPTTWGVKMGCVDVPMGSGNVVTPNYPLHAIETANGALQTLGGGTPRVPPGPGPSPLVGRASLAGPVALVVAGTVGWYLGRWALGAIRRRR